ncbi:hypothetical protein WJX73_007626 [Symbiochloris irregularis]|uniref:Adenylate kinase isoenzyme 6 homolog n=1 Tax=Symbiochloris irregularis TaxID=706552 RepID=A0AAW1P9F7_9CHLO
MVKPRPPNILITGTPGTGKSTTAEAIAESSSLRYINVGDWVKQGSLHSGWDDEHDCFTIDEDKVCDALEDQLSKGGNIVDYHGCEFFPERWFDLIIVLQTDNSILYERLEKRGYSQAKITENVECEIMHVIVEEAFDSYKRELVQVLQSNTVQDMDSNVERTLQWLQHYASS